MRALLTACLIAIISMPMFGQVAVKTNLLYDAMTTPNLGVEVGVGEKSTVNLVYGLNAWKFNSDTHGKRYAKHWVVMPEYRYWLCTKFAGHFLGGHLFGGQMNAANVALPIPGAFFSGVNLTKAAKTDRYQGWFAGLGVTYGYQWALTRHWNIEGEVGVGYGYVDYDKYPCGECGKIMQTGHTNYLGVTKLGVSIMYIF